MFVNCGWKMNNVLWKDSLVLCMMHNKTDSNPLDNICILLSIIYFSSSFKHFSLQLEELLTLLLVDFTFLNNV